MESRRDQFDFDAELRGLRPIPLPAFAAQLDARVAAGFAPATTASPSSPHRRIAGWARGAIGGRLGGHGLLLPAGALAAIAIAIATVAVLTTEGGSKDGRTVAVVPNEGRTAAAAPGNASRPHGEAHIHAFSAPLQTLNSRAVSPAVGASASEGLSAELTTSANDSFVTPSLRSLSSKGVGPYAIGVAHRDIERSAQIVLGDSPANVRDDAAKVFETVRAFRGIVLRSSIGDGGRGEAGATFNLLIPSGKLGEAMAAFSAIADVRSRHESGVDVTAPTIGLGERLQDARARVAGLLTEVAHAETEEEREAAELKLRAAHRQVASLRSSLMDLQRRTHLSSVWLRIETRGEAGGSGNGWGMGDALRQAGHILAVAAGVTLIGLAILAPLALIVLAVWLARRAWVSRRRERALG